MGGFDTALFIEPLDASLLCNICLGVFDRPTSACSNGHFYCAECLRQTKSAANSNIQKNCPECRIPMLSAQVLNRPLMNMITSKQVQCCNVTAGSKTRRLTEAGGAVTTLGGKCQWRGTLSQFVAANHAQTCLHRIVQCTLGCKERLIFSELEDHKAACPHRLTKCPACKLNLKCNALSSHTKEHCPERTVSCGYCKVQLKKKNLGTIKGRDPVRMPFLGVLGAVTDADVTGHYKVCPKIRLSCEFHPFGCSTKIVRQRMAAHHVEKSQHHAALVTKKTKSIEDSMAKMKRELQTNVENAGKRIKKDLMWNVDREQLRGEGNKTIKSKTFTVAGYELQFRLQTIGQVVTVELYVVSAPNHDLIILENVVFESTAGTGDGCEEVSFCYHDFVEDDELEDVSIGGHRVLGGSMTWYDEEEDVDISAAKDQLLACTCDSMTHVQINVKFDLMVPTQEVV